MTPTEVLQQLNQAGLHPPKTLTVAVTDACNLACRHCWVEAGGQASPAHVPLPLLRRIIGEFAALGGEGLRLTGGEPLCHPEWGELMRFSRACGFGTLALQTNGMLFSDEHLSVLRELDYPGLSIQISLDGATAETHDLVRGEGAFTGVLDGILKLAQGGLAGRISLFMTEMRHNLEDIPAILEFAAGIGIDSFSSGALVLCGRATGGGGDNISPSGSEQFLRLLERYDADPRFRELYRKFGTVAALEWHAGAAVRHDCCTFVENPYLTPSGRLYPCLLCHTDDFSVCSVYEKGLAAAVVEGAPLWSSLLRISTSRAAAIPGCRDCPGRLGCAGGCMGRAWGSCQDLLAADDRCGVRRTIYEQVCSSRR